MTDSRKIPVLASLAVGAAGGALASWVKAQAEPPLQKLGEQLFPPAPGEEDRPGADSTNSPEKMPPSILTEKVAAAAGRPGPDDDTVGKASTAIHYGFGIGFGVAYAVAVRSVPALAGGLGAPAGLALYGATHASTLPAIGVQAPLSKLPRSAYVFEAGSHAVYGVVLDLTRRLLSLPWRG